MVKKLLIAGGILVVILLAGFKYLASNLDSIVEKAITRVGSEVTGVPVDVSRVGIDLADGRGEIKGLVIGNPRGYDGPHAFKLGSVVLALDASSEAKDVVVIRELTIEAPDVVYDKGTEGSNVEAIQRNVEGYATARGSDAPKEDAAAAKRFIIGSLQIRNGKIRLPGREAVVDLPPVQLRDVGKSQGGMTGDEIAGIIVKQMTSATIASAARALAQDLAQEGANRAKSEVKSRLPRR